MTDAPPFSRLVRIDALPADGLSQTIEASQDERAALAALDRPAGDRQPDGQLYGASQPAAAGSGDRRGPAEVARLCVVTLEPFTATVDTGQRAFCAGGGGRGAAQRDDDAETVEIGGEDPPDRDGKIDLGALAASLRPSPRSLSAQARRRVRAA